MSTADRRRVVLFGVGAIAELAHFYLTHDSPHEVVAFTVDGDYIAADTFHDLPVVPFETVEQSFPPGEHAMFLPISFKRMNHLRADKLASAKERGFEVISYVSSKATTFPDFECGENCFILEDNTIQPFVKIGRNVILWSGNHIGHHTTIGDHVSLLPGANVAGNVTIGDRAFVGMGALVLDGLTIGDRAVVAAGAVVTRDVPPGVQVVGIPASVVAETPDGR
jgi:sugar O-acyltransferase (sialic acid O-acetyltransferase NeuD family)